MDREFPVGTIAVWTTTVNSRPHLIAWRQAKDDKWTATTLNGGTNVQEAFGDDVVWSDIERGSCKIIYIPDE